MMDYGVMVKDQDWVLSASAMEMFIAGHGEMMSCMGR